MKSNINIIISSNNNNNTRLLLLFIILTTHFTISTSFLSSKRSSKVALFHSNNFKKKSSPLIPVLPSTTTCCATTTTNDNPVTSSSYSSGIAIASFDEPATVAVIDTILFPQSEYDLRVKAGEMYMNLQESSFVTRNDLRLSYTYAEFPLESFGYIIQRANQYLPELEMLNLSHGGDNDKVQPSSTSMNESMTNAQPTEEEILKSKPLKHFIDLGSGCGRLCFYAALTLERWVVHGIEISPSLHDVACMSLKRGMKEGLFYNTSSSNYQEEDEDKLDGSTEILFHEGAVDNLKNILHQADVIFGYSTAWPAPEFNQEEEAVVLGDEWSSMLANTCKEGCIAITTDRILNTNDGWIVLDRFDVDNPELGGSIAYIQMLKRELI